jgi:hypothetical protein
MWLKKERSIDEGVHMHPQPIQRVPQQDSALGKATNSMRCSLPLPIPRINHLEAEISDEDCNMSSGIGSDPSQQRKISRSKAAESRLPTLLCIRQISRNLLLSIMATRDSIPVSRMALVPKFSKDHQSFM